MNPPRTTPVALFVYNRPEHTAKTLEALARNRRADETDLVVFSDGPRSAADNDDVKAVRALCERAEGFRSVEIESQETNRGLATSIIGGVTAMLGRHDRVIVLEDDLVTHPDALEYFNSALDFYQNYPTVFSVSGYTHPPSLLPMPPDYAYDVYAIWRMQCWGWATWRDRWAKADFSMADFARFRADKGAMRAYRHAIGSDSLRTLEACVAGEKDVWACRWVYTHFKHGAVCLCPTRSLIDNIGLDGSGSNCGASTLFANEFEHRYKTFRFPAFVQVDPRIFEHFMTVMDRQRDKHRIVADGVPTDGNRGGARPGLLARIRYWSRRPGALLERLMEGARRQEQITETPGAAPDPHDTMRVEPAPAMERFGTDYGGWWLPLDALDSDSVVVSAGAGEDISFDIEIARRFGCRVFILDPTPRAVRHFEATIEALRVGAPAPVNNDPTTVYPADTSVLDRLSFHPVGLWYEDTIQRFFPPRNPAHVSHSIGNMHGTDGGFEAECITLSTLFERTGVDRVDILKLDIEGAEFPVIEHLLASSIRPRLLLAEFHPGQDPGERRDRRRVRDLMQRLDAAGYVLLRHDSWDYVFGLGSDSARAGAKRASMERVKC